MDLYYPGGRWPQVKSSSSWQHGVKTSLVSGVACNYYQREYLGFPLINVMLASFLVDICCLKHLAQISIFLKALSLIISLSHSRSCPDPPSQVSGDELILCEPKLFSRSLFTLDLREEGEPFLSGNL